MHTIFKILFIYDYGILPGRVHDQYNVKKGMERYDLLINEQFLIGWDNLLRGKFTKQWKIS